jgi:beta-phosphoglucomutase
MAVRAIIFDLDGTLADTEQLHFEAYNKVLGAHGIQLTLADYFSRLIGYNDHDCFSLLLREQRVVANEARIGELIAQKTAVYQAIVAEREVLFPGAAEFVRRCAERFPLALVTGSLRVEAEMILRRGQIREPFAEIIAAEDVEQGKPAPDGFKMALGRLGFVRRAHPSIAAGECLAIEDTQVGVKAAQQAGMRVLAVAQTIAPGELAGADIVRPSLTETDLDQVLRLLAAIRPQPRL